MLRTPVAWSTLRLGLPLALGMLLHAGVNLVDLWMVGRIGAPALAGTHVATLVNFLPMIIGNGMSVVILAELSRRIGSGDWQSAREYSARAQYFLILTGLLLGLLGAATAVPSVDFQGVTGSARGIGIHYLVVIQLGSVSMFALMAATTAMRAVGETAMPVLLLLLANVINVVLNFGLMFGPDLALWDTPEKGWAPGAAYATVIARSATAVLAYLWLRRRKHPLRIYWAGWRAPAGERAAILNQAVPQTVQMVVRTCASILVTRVVAQRAGPDGVAAFGVAARLDTLVLFASIGFASAATTVAGHCIGAGTLGRARPAIRMAALYAVLFAALLIALLNLWPRVLVDIFVRDASPQVYAQMVEYLGLAALAHLGASYCIAVTGGWNGTGVPRLPMFLDLLGHLLALPVLWILVAQPGASLQGLWWLLLGLHTGLALLYAWVLERTRSWLPAMSG